MLSMPDVYMYDQFTQPSLLIILKNKVKKCVLCVLKKVTLSSLVKSNLLFYEVCSINITISLKKLKIIYVQQAAT